MLEPADHAPAPTLIVLRYGDPIVDALRAAGPGPLVVLRVLPPPLASSPVGHGEGLEPLQPSARAHLAGLLAGRWPAPRLVLRFGEPIQQASSLVAEIGPGRIVCARNLARRLEAAVAAPVVAAEDAGPVRRRRPLSRAVEFVRRAIDREDVKVSALRALSMLDGVATSDLRRLAAQLDCGEVGPGHVLVAEGHRNGTLWLLLAGSVQRSIRGREVGRLHAPALVGGPSILYQGPAIATVTALEPVKALVAGRDQFRAIEAIDAVALRLRAATADRLGDYLGASIGGGALAGS
jgi:CRP-like cAMP-binding protein